MTIDFHAHVLPGVDHGSSGMTESAQQLQKMKQLGVDAVVASSHFYPYAHTVKGYLKSATQAMAGITEQISQENRPRLYRGAEVLLCEGMDRMEGLERLCIEGTDCLLLELPFSHWSSELVQTAHRLLSRDMTVVLAHIDRYPDRMEIINELLAKGAKAQLNAAAFAKKYARSMWKTYCISGSIVALGSDLHGHKKREICQLLATQKWLDQTYLDVMKRTEALLESAKAY